MEFRTRKRSDPFECYSYSNPELHFVVESTSLKVAYLAIIRESRLNNIEWAVIIGKCEIRILLEKKRRITQFKVDNFTNYDTIML